MPFLWQRKQRVLLPRRNILISATALTFLIAYLAFNLIQEIDSSTADLPVVNYRAPEKRPWPSRVSCRGPRGHLLSDGGEDVIVPSKLDIEYPAPQIGAHEELGLEQLWMTGYDRYGPYGFWDNHSSPVGSQNLHTRVEWSKIDWAVLQDDCLTRNAVHFSNTTTIADALRRGFENRTGEESSTKTPARPPNLTGRTALVLRLWDAYNYTQEDHWHIRSLIVETSLSSGGEYAVFLLVDAKDRDIYSSKAVYDEVLSELVPEEFRSIAIMFNQEILNNWYRKTQPYEIKDQMLQPMQLFTYFISGFDHYWNLEADLRFSSEAGVYLKAVSDFARNEPRKQSRERSSFTYLPSIHGSYQHFMSRVNAAMSPNPDSGVWGPLRIPEVFPIGPTPPVNQSEDDFYWGIGEDADAIVTSPCTTALELTHYVWRHWTRGFQDPENTPRTHCPPAVARGSWNLYNVIHWAQVEQGLAVPAEDTLPSFALWHGLKMSLPPQPSYYWHPPRMKEIDKLFNGGPKIAADGLAHGDAAYNDTRLDIADSKTWWHFSPFPRVLMNQWLYGLKEGEKLEYLLKQTDDGRIWMPTLALHPVKNAETS